MTSDKRIATRAEIDAWLRETRDAAFAKSCEEANRRALDAARERHARADTQAAERAHVSR